MTHVNPFKPSAGVEPPVLIGRNDVLYDFEESLISGVGAPGRLMRITGPRGSGKTVLLNELGDVARKHGWRVVDETVQPNWVESLCRRLVVNGELDLAAELDLGFVRASAKKVAAEEALDIRESLDIVVSKLTHAGKGLLVTVDEVQNASLEDITRIAAAVQHLMREKKNIAFAFAGIASGVNSLLSEDGPTFLRRAYHEELDALPLDEVALSLAETIRRSGFEMADDLVRTASDATGGYAYLVQLVGYHIWRAAKMRGGEAVVDEEDVAVGVARAKADYERSVIETAIAGISLRAMQYLLAMAEDDAVSSTAELAGRLGIAASSLSSVRLQLIERQVIEPTAYGFVAFSMPYTADYLRRNRAQLLARYGIEEG